MMRNGNLPRVLLVDAVAIANSVGTPALTSKSLCRTTPSEWVTVDHQPLPGMHMDFYFDAPCSFWQTREQEQQAIQSIAEALRETIEGVRQPPRSHVYLSPLPCAFFAGGDAAALVVQPPHCFPSLRSSITSISGAGLGMDSSSGETLQPFNCLPCLPRPPPNHQGDGSGGCGCSCGHLAGVEDVNCSSTTMRTINHFQPIS